MGRNNELRVIIFPQHIVDQNDKGQLSLRRKRGFGSSSKNKPFL
jgi:hypothetical protein